VVASRIKNPLHYLNKPNKLPKPQKNEKQKYTGLYRRILSAIPNQSYAFLAQVYALAAHQVFCTEP
jgi:hypothetical protein